MFREESHGNSNTGSKTQSSNVDFVSKTSQFINNRKKYNQSYRKPNPNFKCTH